MTKLPNPIKRTTKFVMSAVAAPPNTRVLYVELSDGYISLARLEDIEAIIRRTRIDEIERMTQVKVSHNDPTSVAVAMQWYIANRLDELNAAPPVRPEEGR